MAAHAHLLLEAAETINSSLDSPALETTILGEAARLTGAGASALLVSKGDVLVAQEVLGLDDRSRSRFLVPLETSVFGRALVAGEILVEDYEGEAGSDGVPGRRPWSTVVVAPLRSHRRDLRRPGAVLRGVTRDSPRKRRRRSAPWRSTRRSLSTTAG